MLKKSIKYTDFNGEQATDIHYFNLTTTELIELELSQDGFIEMLKRIVETRDNVQLFAMFKKIILGAYGRKSDDGRRFDKFDADGRSYSVEFSQTAAYDALFLEFALDQDKLIEFIKGVMPASLTTSVEGDINEALKKQFGATDPSTLLTQTQLPPPPPTVA